jgi:hypothetical protein
MTIFYHILLKMSRKIVRDGKRTRKNDKKPRKMVKINKDSRNRENDKKS